ncbi:glycosyltransferase family protein [Candidatus Thioglobus sp.]|jgi:spore coat polysaccharide biosynthesis protein SpsF|nr:glycosyltransferase family protein [Candidatus Thioglobus sp.]
MKKYKCQVDIIIEARMTSSRLPGKILLEAVGRPMLGLMIERLKNVDNISNIIIATTLNQSDDKVEELANRENILCYRGSEDDVLGRVLESAFFFETDVIVEITGDNPLSDPTLVSNMIDKFLELSSDIDFLSNDVGYYNDDIPVSFPLGLNVKVFKRDLLESVERKTNDPLDREHVVNYILKNISQYRVYNYMASGVYHRPELRFTMDYQEDYLLIKEVFEHLYHNDKKFTTEDIINFLDLNVDIKTLNSACVQNRYIYK